MIDETLRHYKIVQLLAQGGMGEVYDFAVSPDESHLVVAHGQTLRDIVLIENFR